jgi:hypothetical protein
METPTGAKCFCTFQHSMYFFCAAAIDIELKIIAVVVASSGFTVMRMQGHMKAGIDSDENMIVEGHNLLVFPVRYITKVDYDSLLDAYCITLSLDPLSSYYS